MSIVEFLIARIEEDAAVAAAAQGRNSPQWISDDGGDVYAVVGRLDDPDRCQHHDNKGQPNPCDDTDVAGGDDLWDDPVLLLARGHHIARHDPARVLAECEAKRQVLSLLDIAEQHSDRVRRSASEYRVVSQAEVPCAVLLCVVQRLALPHADHPDYRPEWRP